MRRGAAFGERGADLYVPLTGEDTPGTHLHTPTHTIDFLSGIFVASPGTHVFTSLLHLYPSV